MFAENVVPGRVLVWFWVWRDGRGYHSVSAFGSSMGTDIRSSFGAAILCVVFWRRKVVVCFSGTEYGRLVLSKQSKPRSLGGAGDLKGKTWNYSVSNAQNVQANGYKMDPLLPLLTSMRKCFLKTFHSLIGSRAFAPQLTPASCITCS